MIAEPGTVTIVTYVRLYAFASKYGALAVRVDPDLVEVDVVWDAGDVTEGEEVLWLPSAVQPRLERGTI